MIFVLMVFLALTFGLFRLDYKKGDLQEIKAQLPPEIHDALEKAENVSRDLNAKVRELYIKAMVKVEELSSHVFSKEKPKMTSCRACTQAEREAEEKANEDALLAMKKMKEE